MRVNHEMGCKYLSGYLSNELKFIDLKHADQSIY